MQTHFAVSRVWRLRSTFDAHRFGIDWQAVECDYRAGRLSLREMAVKHGCSHSSIANRADRHAWTRASGSPRSACPERAKAPP